MSSTQYVKNATKTVEGMFKDEERQSRKFKLDWKQPLPNGYQPELDNNYELIPDLAPRYIQLIGILRWEVELGRIEIFMEVAVMSQYSVSPWLVQLEGLYHMSEYLRKHYMYRLLFYLFQLNIYESAFASGETDCKEFYRNIKGDLNTGITEPLGKNTHTACFLMLNMLVMLLPGVLTQEFLFMWQIRQLSGSKIIRILLRSVHLVLNFLQCGSWEI